MIRFVQFDETYIPQMAELLAARHALERKRFPFLSDRFESPIAAAELLIEETARPYAAGVVALRYDEVIGYMLYEFKQDAVRGRYVSIGYPSLAVKNGEHSRLVRLLYAEAGAEWVRNGYFEHVLYVPVGNDAIILEWLEQSFRFDQRFAVLPLEDYEPKGDGTTTVEFRKVEDDPSILQKMAHWNSLHQATAPAWKPITKENLEEERKNYEELAGSRGIQLWIAEQNDIPAAFHVYKPQEANTMVASENAAYLVSASTNMELRGKGIGKAIADHCFQEIKILGYEHILVDWHTPNHLASYFWPKLGFQSYMIRMVRTVDSRIAWAHGSQ